MTKHYYHSHAIFAMCPLCMVLLLFFSLSFLPTKAQTALPKKLRIVSYNIHHGEGMDVKLDFERIGKLFEKQNADIIAVQEVDSFTARTQGRYSLGEIAAQIGYFATYGPSIPYSTGKYGVGILSKKKPIGVRQVPLPGRSEARTLLVTEFEDYAFACTHLSLEESERIASIDIIEKMAQSFDKPFLIAGDWNDYPKSAFMKAMRERFQILTNEKENTFPADKPKDCIDYIAIYKKPSRRNLPNRVSDKSYSAYINETAVVNMNAVINEPVASDHRPVMVDITLPTPADQLMTTKPYLQLATPTSMDVFFQTNSVCHCWVEFGTDSLHTQSVRALVDGQEVCYDIENRISLTNLRAGTRYIYRVCAVELLMKRGYENHFGDTIRTKFYSFTTPDEQKTDFSCLIFNDLHDNKECFDHLRDLVKGIPYDFVIFNGDCLSEPSNRDHAIRLIHSLADPVNGAEKPIIFLRGNHEIRNYYSAGMHSLIGYYNDKTYSAFNWGNTRFVLLDCGEDKPDDTPVYAGLNDFTQLRNDQVNFLQTELKSKAFKKAAHRVLISHIPVFGNVDSYKPCLELWSPLLKNAPFNVAIGAHNHEAKYYPNGTDGSRYPVLIGGGPSVNNGTVTVLSKRGKELQLMVYSKNKNQQLQVKF